MEFAIKEALPYFVPLWIVSSYARPRKLFERDNLCTIEPMDVNFTFDNFQKFYEFTDNGRCLDSGDALLYWQWVPSFKKAQAYNLRDVLDFFDNVEYDDEYKQGADGHPHDDKENHLIYKDEDYLLIYTHRIWNGFHSHSYKITVTDEDEVNVQNLISEMIQKTIKSWN